MEPYLPIIAATFIGFVALAALLLIPVWRFIQRETARGEAWNRSIIAKERARREKRLDQSNDDAQQR